MYDIRNLKSWFADKFYATLTSTEQYCLSISDEAPAVIKETEKAVQLQFVCDFGKQAFWFPKSAFMTEEDIVAEKARQQERSANYESVVEKAKSLGCKGARKGLKLSTLNEMINNKLAENREGELK